MKIQNGDILIQRICDASRSDEARSEDAYALLQELFHGYPILNLKALLDGGEVGAVEVGVWVLSELGGEAKPLLGRVDRLLEHPGRKVKYWAIDVVHSSAGVDDGKLIGKAFGLLEDTDIAVRRAALYFLAHASKQQLAAAIEQLGTSKLGILLAWLSSAADDASVQGMLSRIDDDDRIVRMVAVAAAVRIAGLGRPVLERAAALGDAEISMFASRELGH
ncbi:hypothetical protein Lfu02_08970 [Longispora fulva]|uniref:HEAT repeat protein n=1 Tax=Longispora fulva TaxID=619741 RepID=A0A8J7GP25_9ACTN|nr:hypothetical protein [Longispora fulva]MBG6135238.1 hypothetical protein [Longispora fulva]GIG56525.1 hypothetical protein Lfu02_08970 [Longispora fulva]